jgi:hypothetical protein
MRETWNDFVLFVNGFVLELLELFKNLNRWGWLWLLFGLWFVIMYVWFRELPRIVRLLYYCLLVTYFVSLPFVLMMFSS